MRFRSIFSVVGLLLAWTPLFAQGPRFAYVVNEGSNAVSVYAVDRATGALTQVSVAATGSIPTSIAVDPPGHFAFVANNAETVGAPTLSVYTIEPHTGALTQIPGSPFPTHIRPNGMAVHPSGKFLYVAHNWFAASVSAYSIDALSGALTEISGSPYATGNGHGTWSVATDPAGKFLFVANGDNPNVPVFSIDPNTGALTPVAGSPFPAPGNNNAVDVVDPTGRFLYTSTNGSQVAGYSINPTTGALAPVTGSPFAAGVGTTGVVMHPTGRFLYAANQTTRNISGYSINSGSGALSAVPGSPFLAGNGAFVPTIDPTGTFLYVPNTYAANISAYSIDPNTGALTPIPGSPFAAGTEPVWMAVVDENPTAALSLLPTHGGNAGTVTVQIFGSGFQSGATVTLTGSALDIVGTNTTVPNASALTTTFDLTGATPGVRNVVITNPDGTTATLTGGFTVEEGGAAQISVNIIGREAIRFGQASTYYLQIQNSGSVDSGPSIVSLSIPSNVAYQQMSGPALFAAGSTSAPEFGVPEPTGTTTGQALLFATSAVPAGGSQFAPVALTLPVGAIPSQFTATVAWQSGITDLTFDQYLASIGESYIPFQATCTQCYTQAVSQVDAITSAQTAYTTWQNAMQDVQTEQIQSNVSVGSILAQTAVVSALGLVGPEAALLGAVIASGKFFANHFFDGASDPDANKSLFVNNVLAAQLALLADPAAKALPAVALLLTVFKFQIAALQAERSIDQVLGLEIAAQGAFQEFLTQYEQARSEYQSCLSTACGNPPPPPPPPPLPIQPLPVQGVGSLDPNVKMGPIGAGPSAYITGLAGMGYSVYFDNEPTATAPAQAITITDTLIANLDPTTITLGPISFPNQVVTPPSIPLSVAPFSTTVDLRPTTNLLVQINASLNTTTRILTWTFQSLDPSTQQPPTDPLAGFLPPGGEGSVFFTVSPKSTLTTGAVIQNAATVVFDVNPPINTPTWSNTIDATVPVSKVAALPATEPSASFAVNWSGTDVGSGVQYYTIYVSDSGGPFKPWLSQTSSTSATFGGANGHSYSFYSVATDFVGNTEVAKAIPDTTTTINVITVSPIAKAGGPYDFCPNLSNGSPIYTPWYLDGSQSINPDNGKTDGTPGVPASKIVAYDWDFNGLNTFTDAHGAQVRVDTGAGNFFTKQGQSFAVGLRVTNNDNLAFPTAGLPAGLTGIASAQVFVHNASDPDCTHCVSTVSASAKASTPGVPGNIQLYWKDTSSAAFPFDHYNVYRSVNADFSGYQQIAGARSIYGIPAVKVTNPGGGTEFFVDSNVGVNGSYYYRVAPATTGDVETCSSNLTLKVTLPKGR